MWPVVAAKEENAIMYTMWMGGDAREGKKHLPQHQHRSLYEVVRICLSQIKSQNVGISSVWQVKVDRLCVTLAGRCLCASRDELNTMLGVIHFHRMLLSSAYCVGVSHTDKHTHVQGLYAAFTCTL